MEDGRTIYSLEKLRTIAYETFNDVAFGVPLDSTPVLYDAVYYSCYMSREHDVYDIIYTLLRKCRFIYHNVVFLQEVKYGGFPQEKVSLWCEWYTFLKQKTQSRHLAYRILNLALQPTEDLLWKASKTILKKAAYLSRFWLANNKKSVVWGDELLFEIGYSELGSTSAQVDDSPLPFRAKKRIKF